MTKTQILFGICSLLILGYAYSQEIKKDKIFLDFSHYQEKCEQTDLTEYLKVKKKEGVQFNLCGKAIFFNPIKFQADTIDNKYLSDYPITELEEIDELVNSWQKRTEPLLIKKYGKLYPKTTNMNNIFETYLMERLDNNCFALYRVYWKNQEIRQ